MSNANHDCGDSCCHTATMSSVHQTLSEMKFERGLWSAALDGDTDRVDYLISHSSDVNAVDSSSYTPLHYAARNGHNEICKKLICHGAKVNIATRSGSTPLHRAAYCGHTSTVKLLLEAETDVRLCDSDHQTALHKAAEQGHFDVLLMILSHDNSVQGMKDLRQRCAYDCLPQNIDEKVRKLFDQHNER